MTKETIKEAMKLTELVETLHRGIEKGDFWVCFQSQWMFEEEFRKKLGFEINERLRAHVKERLASAQNRLKELGVSDV